MLTAYQTQFQNLIQAPSSPLPLISSAQATTYINAAREQVASDGECIRAPGSLVLTPGLQYAGFSLISPATAFAAGIGGAMSIRFAFIADGGPMLDIRSWEWFSAYYLQDATTGLPARVAQQGQGALGVLFFSPIPSLAYGIVVDAAWLPIPLVDDSTFEAIPYPWTDAVPFWAAWLGLMSLQRQADADMAMARYKELMARGRRDSTPSVLPSNLPGDLGAKLAGSKTALSVAPQQGRGA